MSPASVRRDENAGEEGGKEKDGEDGREEKDRAFDILIGRLVSSTVNEDEE